MSTIDNKDNFGNIYVKKEFRQRGYKLKTRELAKQVIEIFGKDEVNKALTLNY